MAENGAVRGVKFEGRKGAPDIEEHVGGGGDEVGV